MIRLSLLEIKQALNAHYQLIEQHVSAEQKQNQDAVNESLSNEYLFANQIKTDTRKIELSDLFIALNGEQFDGHHFVLNAIKSGAVYLIIEHPNSSKLAKEISTYLQEINPISDASDANGIQKIHLFSVESTLHALGQLGHLTRQKSCARFVALTGSSGKTSVKEMTAAILAEMGETLFTAGNFNNEIGVPLTLLRLTGSEQFAVIELGANHQKEIEYTASLVEPESVLINNISAAHLEGFGSLLGIAKAKSEIVTFRQLPSLQAQYLDRPLNVLLNQSLFSTKDKQVKAYWDELFDNTPNVKLFGMNSEQTSERYRASCYATELNVTAEGSSFILNTELGRCEVKITILGHHAISNALAAASLALSVGATLDAVKNGLAKVKPVKGRLFPIQLAEQQWIIDDSYNANVGSMQAAIDVLNQQQGYRILVVGDMAELGEYSNMCHQQVGEYAKHSQIDRVYSVGNYAHLISAQHQNGIHFQHKSDLIETLKRDRLTYSNLTILVKGSRSARMEEIIQVLQEK